MVKMYKPEYYLVQFYMVKPGQKIGVIEVGCIELNGSQTKVQVAYEYIGLSETGNVFVSSFSSSDYNAFIAEWEALLVKYLQKAPTSPSTVTVKSGVPSSAGFSLPVMANVMC